MELSSFTFYMLSIIIIAFSAAVVLLPSPIYSALALAGAMVCLAFTYFLLEAHFIAGVQLIVYAGAVMVLFVMVLMLFDLKKEVQIFSGSVVSVFLKLFSGLIVTAAIVFAIAPSVISSSATKGVSTPAEQMAGVKELAGLLFTKYVLAFEVLGILLLIIAIGVVAVSRTKGGTHARD